MLVVNKLTVHRGDKACVDSVSAEFHSGQLTAIAGPNGAGKSSLLKLISGEWTADSGEIEILGKAAARWQPKERARVMAVMPQQQRIGFDFKVAELVRLGRAPHMTNSSAQLDQETIEFCLSFVGLKGYENRSVLTLSGGELQRAYLAKAVAQICTRPRQLPGEATVLLLDEPTSALDMAQQITAMTAAREIARSGGTVVAVMHDLNLVSSFADKVLLMKQGRVLAKGEPAEVLQARQLRECFDCEVLVDERACDQKRLLSVRAMQGPDPIS